MKVHPSHLNVNHNSDFSALKVGQIIKARIVEMINRNVILDIGNGVTLEAHTEIPLKNSESDYIYFYIVKFANNQMVIRPMSFKGINQNNSLETKISNILEKMDIKPTAENKELVKKLLDHQIPIKKQNFLEINRTKMQFQRIVELLHNDRGDVPEDLYSKDLNGVLRRLMGIVNDSKEETIYFFQKTKDINDESNNMKNNTIALNGMLLKKDIDKSHFEILWKRSDLNKNLKEIYSTFKTINIHDMNFDKIIFLNKHNLKINMENATFVNNIIFHDLTVTDQLTILIKSLEKSDNTMHLSKGLASVCEELKDMILEGRFKPFEIVKELYTKLELIEQNIKNLNNQENIEVLNQIANLKNSLEFLHKISQFQTFLQIPINIGDQHKTLDLYISTNRKRKKKIDSQNIQIFISLETKTMDMVQVLVEIREKDIHCNFKITSEEIKKFLVYHEQILKDGLLAKGFRNVYIKFAIMRNAMNFADVEKNMQSSKLNFIDLRV